VAWLIEVITTWLVFDWVKLGGGLWRTRLLSGPDIGTGNIGKPEYLARQVFERLHFLNESTNPLNAESKQFHTSTELELIQILIDEISNLMIKFSKLLPFGFSRCSSETIFFLTPMHHLKIAKFDHVVLLSGCVVQLLFDLCNISFIYIQNPNFIRLYRGHILVVGLVMGETMWSPNFFTLYFHPSSLLGAFLHIEYDQLYRVGSVLES